MGSIGSASEILHKFNNRNPGFLAIESRLMTIEYRQAKKAAKDKEPDYSDLIQRYEKLVHNAQAPREVCSYYAMRLAMFHAKVRNDPKLAGKVLNDAISYDRRNYRLYKHLIDVAFAYQPLNESAVLGALEQAINSNDLTYEHRLQFSSRRMEFLDEYGTDMKETDRSQPVGRATTSIWEPISACNKRSKPAEINNQTIINCKAASSRFFFFNLALFKLGFRFLMEYFRSVKIFVVAEELIGPDWDIFLGGVIAGLILVLTFFHMRR
ncbi:hypothetical protein L596_022160 [Steinernema carpocapsae]|uniref:Suppressor of forked domain-containing protein n=1 Tax=Steinernema carpocapsae TaxID=34508 RepID=A0A4U5MLR5_STECR|nr:hypothetical protein L596_022160 [Steinernema carpocapsae]